MLRTRNNLKYKKADGTWASVIGGGSGSSGGEVTVVKETTPETGYQATYNIKQDGTSVGKVNIPKDYVVKEFTIKQVTTADTPVSGYKVGEYYLDLEINDKENTETATHKYVNLKAISKEYKDGIGIEIDPENKINLYNDNETIGLNTDDKVCVKNYSLDVINIKEQGIANKGKAIIVNDGGLAEWKEIDEATPDNVTIDKTSADKLEVKEKGLETKHLKDSALTTSLEKIQATSTDEEIPTSKAVYDYSKVELIKETTAESGYIATYTLKQSGENIGKINIPKDYLVKKAELKTCTIDDAPVTGYKVGDKYIDFTINTKDESETDTHLYINLKDLVDVYTGDKAIDVSTDNKISVKYDNNTIGVNASNNLYLKTKTLDETYLKDKLSTDKGKAYVVQNDGSFALQDVSAEKVDNTTIYKNTDDEISVKEKGLETKHFTDATIVTSAEEIKSTSTDTEIATAKATYDIVQTKSKVSVSNTGSATEEVNYITIDGTEKKLPSGGGSSGYEPDNTTIAKNTSNQLMVKDASLTTSKINGTTLVTSSEVSATTTSDEKIMTEKAVVSCLSHVGQVIMSTTLNTMAKVKAVYGGTTWIQHSGYTLRGATSGVVAGSTTKTGGNDSVSYTPTGTVAGHKLTIDEIPSHNHVLNKLGLADLSYSGSNHWIYLANMDTNEPTSYTGGDGEHNHGFTGTTSTITTTNPYKNVYIWERTA